MNRKLGICLRLQGLGVDALGIYLQTLDPYPVFFLIQSRFLGYYFQSNLELVCVQNLLH